MGLFKVTETPPNGDDHLSIYERKLWSLTYSCLYRFGCPVIFHQYGPHAQHRMDRHLTFFVPRDNPQCHVVKEFLQNELADEHRAGEMVTETEYAPGCKVDVLEFEGVDFYLQREEIERMSAQMIDNFMNKFDEVKSKPN